MNVFTYDDGSTLTTADDGSVSSTEASSYNLPSSGWSPSVFNGSAGGWDDVLKLGVSRGIDAITRRIELNDARAQAAKAVPLGTPAANGLRPAGALVISNQALLVIGAGLLVLMMVSK